MLAALLLVAALAGTPAASAQIAQENAALAEAVKMEGDTKATEALEPQALKGSNGRAWRDQSGLHLRLASGRVHLLHNQADCPPPDNKFESCVGYSLVADLESRGVYVVAVNYYEGGDYAVIDDKTGAETKVGPPLQFGPDPTLFITIDNNEAYGDDSITLWRRSGDRFRTIWQDQHGYNAAFLKEWIRPEKIELRLAPISGQPALDRSTAIIVHDRTWHFVGPKP